MSYDSTEGLIGTQGSKSFSPRKECSGKIGDDVTQRYQNKEYQEFSREEKYVEEKYGYHAQKYEEKRYSYEPNIFGKQFQEFLTCIVCKYPDSDNPEYFSEEKKHQKTSDHDPPVNFLASIWMGYKNKENELENQESKKRTKFDILGE